MARSFRTPNVCITHAEADWLLEAAAILEGKVASDRVKKKAATYVKKIAKDAQKADSNPEEKS